MDDNNKFNNSDEYKDNPENEHPNNYNNGYQNNSGYDFNSNSQYGYNNSYGSNGLNPQNPHDHPQESEYKWDFKDYKNASNPEDSMKQKKKNKGLVVFGIIIAALLVVGSVSLISISVYNAFSDYSQEEIAQETMEEPEVEGIILNNKPQAESSYASPDGKLTTEQIAEKVKPSVVGIVNYQQANGLLTSTANEGSGIIMNKDGYIITNAHVVTGASGIKVVLSNGEEYSAQLVGADVDTDLAVIKIDAKDLTYAEFGDSTQVKIGEKAIAIGNPGGLLLQGSVTQGIISAVDRPVLTEGGYQMNVIQTDAAINPGNSGGALINEYGQVIGINSSKIAATDYEGIGFAIPASDAKPILDDLINYGYVKGRVRMGVTISSVDQFMSSIYDVPVGLLVNSVEPNSGAQEAGIVPGDIITKLNGDTVTGSTKVKQVLSQFKPNDTIPVEIYRQAPNGMGGEYLNVKIRLLEATPTPIVTP